MWSGAGVEVQTGQNSGPEIGVQLWLGGETRRQVMPAATLLGVTFLLARCMPA